MILLDANILLEMLISGRRQKAKVLKWMEQNQEPYCISMLSVHLVLHFGLKDRLSLADIKEFLADYPKVPLLPEDYASAMEIMVDDDHEDALQLAMARRAGCTKIATLDQKFAARYKNHLIFIDPTS